MATDNKKTIEDLIKLSDDLMSIGEFKRAEKLIEDYISVYPTDWQIWYGLAKARSKYFICYNGDLNVLNQLLKAVKLAPDEERENLLAVYNGYLNRAKETEERIKKEKIDKRLKQLEKVRKEKNVFNFSLVGVVIVLFLIISILMIVSSSDTKALQSEYDDLKLEYSTLKSRMNAIKQSGDITYISNQLNYLLEKDFVFLPYEKSELYGFRNDLNLIRVDLLDIANNTNSWDWYDENDNFYDENRFIELRSNYRYLYSFSEDDENWDFEELLEEVDLKLFVAFNHLSDSSGYIELEYNSDGSMTLFNSLPNAKESTVAYYFTERIDGRNIIFGYQKQSDASAEFDAIRITIPLDGEEPYTYYNYYEDDTGTLF